MSLMMVVVKRSLLDGGLVAVANATGGVCEIIAVADIVATATATRWSLRMVFLRAEV